MYSSGELAVPFQWVNFIDPTAVEDLQKKSA